MYFVGIVRKLDNASLKAVSSALLLSLFLSISLTLPFRGSAIGVALSSSIAPLWACCTITICAWLSSRQLVCQPARTALAPSVGALAAISLALVVGILQAISVLSLFWLVNGTPWASDAAQNINQVFGAILTMFVAPLRRTNSADVALTAFFLLALKAASEEVIFRYLIFRKLAQARSFLVAALVSSALFAAFHFPSGWMIADAFVAGMCFAALYRFTGRLSAPIMAHVAVNLCLVFLSRGSGRATDAVTSTSQMSSSTLLILIAPVLTYAVVVVCVVVAGGAIVRNPVVPQTSTLSRQL